MRRCLQKISSVLATVVDDIAHTFLQEVLEVFRAVDADLLFCIIGLDEGKNIVCKDICISIRAASVSVLCSQRRAEVFLHGKPASLHCACASP